MSSDFEIKPLGMDFNGLISSGNNIIAYSNNGNYLKTTDKGLSWNQFSLNINGNILLMRNQRDTIWGITDNGLIFRSQDSGQSWLKFPYLLDSGDKIIYFALNDKYLYIRTINKILAFNKDIDLKFTYSDTLINKTFNLSGHQYFSFMDYIDNQLLIATTSQRYEMDGSILVLSDSLKKVKIIDLKNYIDTSKFGRAANEFRGYFKYRGKNIFMIAWHPFTCDSNLTNWQYLLKDSLHSKSDFGWLVQNSMEIKNDKIYIGYYKENFAIAWQDFWTSNIGILKYDDSIDSLKAFKSIFNNNYYTGGSNGFDNLTYGLNYGKLNFIGDSLIIWYGKNKELLQSRDYGKTWELVTTYSNSPAKIILNDTVFYCLEPYSFAVYNTNNGGSTFKPSTLTDTINSLCKFLDPVLFYMGSNGKGFVTGAKKTDNNKNNFAVTLDSGKSFVFSSKSNFWQTATTPNFSDISRFGDKLIFSQNYKDSSRVYLMDFKNFNISLIKTDTSIFTHHISAKNLEHFYMFDYMSSKKYGDLHVFEVNETNDSGQSFKQICAIDRKLQILQVYEYNQDSIFIVSINPNRIFLYERVTNRFDTVYKEDSKTLTFLQIMGMRNKFYIMGSDVFLENNDRSDLTKWQTAIWDYGKPNFFALNFCGETAVAFLKDSLRTNNYYKLTLKPKKKEVNDSKIEVYSGKFLAKPPYPIPSSNQIKVKLYWGDLFDITNTDINIYDITGVNIQNKSNITLNNIQTYSADLQWDCSSVKEGTYFIVINYLGRLEPIQVMVVK